MHNQVVPKGQVMEKVVVYLPLSVRMTLEREAGRKNLGLSPWVRGHLSEVAERLNRSAA